jgi:ABC-type Fe3+-hydroxamate transport system substrate-binding protein
MLKPLGCTNVGEVFNPEHAKPSKGHYMVKKSRGGFDFSPLIQADPDVIVAVGDVMSVQKAIKGYAEKNPKFKNVKAIKDMAVYGLRAYIDSSVIEYPVLLRKWSVALAR